MFSVKPNFVTDIVSIKWIWKHVCDKGAENSTISTIYIPSRVQQEWKQKKEWCQWVWENEGTRQPYLWLFSGRYNATLPHFPKQSLARCLLVLVCVCVFAQRRVLSLLLAELKMLSELPLDLFWEGDSTQQEVLLSFWGRRQLGDTDRKWTYKQVSYSVALQISSFS